MVEFCDLVGVAIVPVSKKLAVKAGATETNLLTKFTHTICESESEREGGQYHVRLFVHGWLATLHMKYVSSHCHFTILKHRKKGRALSNFAFQHC